MVVKELAPRLQPIHTAGYCALGEYSAALSRTKTQRHSWRLTAEAVNFPLLLCSYPLNAWNVPEILFTSYTKNQLWRLKVEGTWNSGVHIQNQGPRKHHRCPCSAPFYPPHYNGLESVCAVRPRAVTSAWSCPRILCWRSTTSSELQFPCTRCLLWLWQKRMQSLFKLHSSPLVIFDTHFSRWLFKIWGKDEQSSLI